MGSSIQVTVVNITTKKSKHNTINFNPYLRYDIFKYYDYTYGASLFGNLKKINFYINLDNYYEKIFNDSHTNQTFYKTNNEIDYFRDDKSNEIVKTNFRNINFTLSYENKKNNLTIAYLKNSVNPTNSESNIKTNIYNNQNVINDFFTDKKGKTKNESDSYSLSYTYNMDTLGKKIKLFADYTQIKYNNNIEININSITSNTQGIETNAKLNSIKLDFNNREKSKFKIETGIKFSWVKNNSQNFSSLFNDYKFIIDENILGTYFSVRRKWENINLNLGTRLENTKIKGDYYDNFINENKSINKNILKVFPNLFFEYIINKNSFSTIINTKIQRPNYGSYNPFKIINDPNTIQIGNPELLPAYIYDYTLQYTYNKKYTFKTFFTNIHNQVSNIIISNENNISINKPINLDYSNYYGISLSGSWELKKWWNINFWGEILNIHKKGKVNNREINIKSKNSFSVSLNQQFKLPKEYYLNLNAFIQGNDTWGGIYTTKNPYGSIDFSAKKEFLNKKLSIEIFLDDILNTNNKINVYYNDDFYSSTIKNYYPGRKLGISLNYIFDKNINKKTLNESNEEKNRAKY